MCLLVNFVYLSYGVHCHVENCTHRPIKVDQIYHRKQQVISILTLRTNSLLTVIGPILSRESVRKGY